MFPSTRSPPESAETVNTSGHAEVALSRCTPVPGLARRHPLESRHVLSDARSETFLKQAAVETAPHQLTF
jgi:hypothetical protein